MRLAHLQEIDRMVLSGIGGFGVLINGRLYDELRADIDRLIGPRRVRDPKLKLPPKAEEKAEELRQWIARNWRFPRTLPSLDC